MADQRGPAGPHDLHSEPVRRPGFARHVDSGRFGHLLQRCGRQDVPGVAQQERGEAGQVGQRRPQLPGRGHRDRVVLGLVEQQVGPRMYGVALGGRRDRPGAGAGHPQRQQHLIADDVLPRPAAQAGDERPEQGEAQVAVVESSARGERGVGAAEPELTKARAGDAFPPLARPLGARTGHVRQQLADGPVPQRGARHVLLERVVQVEPPLVAQSQDRDGGDRLGDRAQPVLHVVVRIGDGPAAGGPREPAVADDPGHQGRRSALPLGACGVGEQADGGRGQDGHRTTVVGSKASRPGDRCTGAARVQSRPAALRSR